MNDRANNTVRKCRAKGRAVAGSHDFGTSKKGTEQIGLRVMLVDGEHAGQTATWYGYFTDAAQERCIESLKTAGWNGEWTPDLDMPGLGSTEFDFQYEEETTPEGSIWLNGNFINRLGVAMSNKMDAAGKAAFAARMRGASVPTQRRATNGSRALPQQQGFDSPPPSDDDIGF